MKGILNGVTVPRGGGAGENQLLRVKRSLTIKLMARITAIAVVTLSIFIVIQLCHFVHQRRADDVRQMENIARSVREPLTAAVLRGDVAQAANILNDLRAVGLLSRADLELPGEVQPLHASFPPERPAPTWVARTFQLPVRVAIPLYTLPQAPGSTPLAHLVLQADSWRMYRFILGTFSTLLVTYLLLALILSVAVTWCVKKVMINPLRGVVAEMQAAPTRRLTLSARHRDDELGMLVRLYNRALEKRAAKSPDDALR